MFKRAIIFLVAILVASSPAMAVDYFPPQRLELDIDFLDSLSEEQREYLESHLSETNDLKAEDEDGYENFDMHEIETASKDSDDTLTQE